MGRVEEGRKYLESRMPPRELAAGDSHKLVRSTSEDLTKMSPVQESSVVERNSICF